MTIGSLAELKDRLPEIGTPLKGSGKRVWLSENGDLLPAGAERTTGAFKRQPRAFGLSGNVNLPEPDAIGYTSSDGISSSSAGSKDTPTTTNGSVEEPCEVGLDGECIEYTPPNFTGSSALYLDDALRLGQTTAESTTDIEGSPFPLVDEVSARSTVDFTINGGEYQESGVPYTFTRVNGNVASATTLRFNFADQTDWTNSGEHWYVDTRPDGTEFNSDEITSSATAQTNFPTSTCAPFPIWIVEGHEDGQTYQENEEISLEWQTICPQFDKQLRIRRTSGPGGSRNSRWVTTGGDGWGLQPFEAWHGLFLNGGDYEWRVRANGESNYRTGTFSINADDFCRPDFVDVIHTIGIGGEPTSTVDVALPSCTPAGTYELTLWQDTNGPGTNAIGGGSRIKLDRQLASKTVQVNADGPYGFTVSTSQGGGSENEYVTLRRVSPYNGSARLDKETYYSP